MTTIRRLTVDELTMPYSCPDCPQGGERWATSTELADHLRSAHPSLWTSDEQIGVEVTYQRDCFRLADMDVR